MPIKQKKHVTRKKKLSEKRAQKGSVGNFFIFVVLAILMVLGIIAVGGLPSQSFSQTGQVVNIITPTPGQAYSVLQLKWFGYVTLAPTPTPPAGSLCTNRAVNSEPGILAGFFPGQGQSVSTTGQIKIWVNDEGAPIISPDEQINNATGQVTVRGNVSAKAPDGYLWEPALYVGTPVESGGTPHFPDFIKGDYNNAPPSFGNVTQGAPIDPVPQGSRLAQQYTAEYIWNVSDLGVTPGTYPTEFVIHDGDIDRGIGCVSITIQ